MPNKPDFVKDFQKALYLLQKIYYKKYSIESDGVSNPMTLNIRFKFNTNQYFFLFILVFCVLFDL